jgi:hypothetical protein
VSGKSWKEAPSKRASADKNAIVNKHSSWEKKMQEKARKKAFQEQKAAALEAVKSKRKVGGCRCSATSSAVERTWCTVNCVIRQGCGLFGMLRQRQQTGKDTWGVPCSQPRQMD